MLGNRGRKIKKLARFTAAAGITASVIAAACVSAVSKGNAIGSAALLGIGGALLSWFFFCILYSWGELIDAAFSINKALRDLSDIREDIRKIAERLPAPSHIQNTHEEENNTDTDADSVFCPLLSNHVF